MGELFVFAVFLALAGWFFTRSRQTQDGKDKVTPTPVPVIHFPRFFWPAAGLVVLGWNLAFYEAGGALGMSFFAVCSLIATLLIFPKKPNLVAWTLSALVSVAAVGLTMRANGFVQGVNAVVIAGGLGGLLALKALSLVEWRFSWWARYAWEGFTTSWRQVFWLFQQHKQSVQEKKWSVTSVLKTVFITLVVMAFFVSILSSADPVFDKLIQHIRDQALGRTFVSLIVLLGCAVWMSMKIEAKKDADSRLSFFKFHDLLVPATGLVLLFGMFLVVQAKYLFGSQTDLAQFGLSYSEYVRKGFVELLSVTLFGGLVAYLIVAKQRILTEVRERNALAFVGSALIIELGAMLASALKRDLMYVDVYGLTRVRIIGGVFVAWLAVFLILLLVITIWKRVKESVVFAGLLVASSAVILFLNFANIDMIVFNGAPEHHNYEDYFYITNLSEDAVDGWIAAVPKIEDDFRQLKAKGSSLSAQDKSQLAGIKLAAVSLQEKRTKLENKFEPDIQKVILRTHPEDLSDYLSNKDGFNPWWYEELKQTRQWQSWNWSQARAYKEVTEHNDVFGTRLDALVEDIKTFQRLYRYDLSMEERRLMYELTYPFLSINLRYSAQDLGDLDREAGLKR